MTRKDYIAIQDYWFQTADGIRIHYAQLREQEQEEHRRRMDRLNREENDMIDALSKSKGETK